jgi:tRNA threonylcarbamoyladenosine biosynthesis protein TsaB
MILLALETSTTRGGVAVLKDTSTLALIEWERGKSHSELLTSAIETALAKAAISLRDIDVFAVDHGPGSFTGIRVGINAARAFGFAEHKPVIGLSSLEVLAAATPIGDTPLVCLLNAHKNLLYLATFAVNSGSWQMTRSPLACSIADLEGVITTPHLCVGEGFVVYHKYFSKTLSDRLIRQSSLSDQPLALALGQAAKTKFIGNSTFDWNQAVPLYLRVSEAEEKLNK